MPVTMNPTEVLSGHFLAMAGFASICGEEELRRYCAGQPSVGGWSWLELPIRLVHPALYGHQGRILESALHLAESEVDGLYNGELGVSRLDMNLVPTGADDVALAGEAILLLVGRHRDVTGPPTDAELVGCDLRWIAVSGYPLPPAARAKHASQLEVLEQRVGRARRLVELGAPGLVLANETRELHHALSSLVRTVAPETLRYPEPVTTVSWATTEALPPSGLTEDTPYRIDTESGTLHWGQDSGAFEADARLVGTWSEWSQSYLAGWANTWLPPRVRLAPILGFPRGLTDRPFDEARLMAMHCARLAKAEHFVPLPSSRSLAFFALWNVRPRTDGPASRA